MNIATDKATIADLRRQIEVLRAEVIEECAKVADNSARENDETASSFSYTAVLAQKYRARANEAGIIAAAIRALKDTAP